MPDDKSQKLYQNLVSDGYKLGTYDEFIGKMNDPATAQRFHQNMISDGYALGSFDEFQTNLGLKKKGTSQSASDVTDFASLGQNQRTEYVTPLSEGMPQQMPVVNESQLLPDIEPFDPLNKPTTSEQNQIETNRGIGLTKPVQEKTVREYLVNRNIAPEQVGLSPDYNIDKNLTESEKNLFDTKLKLAPQLKPRTDEGDWIDYMDKVGFGLIKNINIGTASAVRSAAGAEKLVRDVISLTGLPKGESVLNKVADRIDEVAEGVPDVPDDYFGEVIRQGGQLEGLMLEMMLPIPKSIAILKLPIILGGSGALTRYGELSDKGAPIKTRAIETAKALGIGVGQGMVFHMMGVTGGKLGELLTKETNSKLVGYLGNLAVNSGGFAGVTAGEQALSGQPIDEKAVISSALFGGVLTIPSLAGALFGTSVNKALNTSTKTIRSIDEAKIEPEKVLNKIEELNKQIEVEPDKPELTTAKTVLENTLVTNAGVQMIKENPKAVIDAVNESELTQTEKEITVEKVNSIVAETDPKHIEAKPINEEIAKLQSEIETVTTNPNYADNEKKLKTAPIEEKIKELDGKVAEIYNPAPKEPVKTEPEPEKPTFDEFKQKQTEGRFVVVGSRIRGEEKPTSDFDYLTEVTPEEATKIPKDWEKSGKWLPKDILDKYKEVREQGGKEKKGDVLVVVPTDTGGKLVYGLYGTPSDVKMQRVGNELSVGMGFEKTTRESGILPKDWTPETTLKHHYEKRYGSADPSKPLITGEKPLEPEQVGEKQVVPVKPFAQGDGGTKGVFRGEGGQLYKSIQPQEIVHTEKGFERKPREGKETDEHQILSELQDNPHIPKIGKIVETSEGKAFEIEKLDEIDQFTIDEYKQIEGILNNINDRGYYVGDKVTVMRRPKTGELVVVDFSSGYKERKGIIPLRDVNNLDGVIDKMDQNDLNVMYYGQKEKVVGLSDKLNIPQPGFRYKMRMRPFGVGTYPKEGFKTHVESGSKGKDGYYDIIEYSKPLSAKEVKSFELEYAGRSETKYPIKAAPDSQFANQESGQNKPVPDNIAQLYLERGQLEFIANALKMQMGGTKLAPKSKAEYDKVKSRLDEVNQQLDEYENPKPEAKAEAVPKLVPKLVPKSEISDGYGSYLMDKVEKMHLAKYPKETDVVASVSNEWKRINEEHGILRANGYLEDLVIANMPKEQRINASSKLRDEYKLTEQVKPKTEQANEIQKETKGQEKPGTGQTGTAEKGKEGKESKEEIKQQRSELAKDLSAFNRLSNKEKATTGANLKAKMNNVVRKLGYSWGPIRKGKYTILNDKGKRLVFVGEKRSPEELKIEKETNEYRKRILWEEPQTLKQLILQYLLKGGRLQTEAYTRNSGLKGKDVPIWLTVSKAKGGVEFDGLQEGLMDHETEFLLRMDSMDFANEVVDIVRMYTKRSEMWKDLAAMHEDAEYNGMSKEQIEYLMAQEESDKELLPYYDENTMQNNRTFADGLTEKEVDQLLRDEADFDEWIKANDSKLNDYGYIENDIQGKETAPVSTFEQTVGTETESANRRKAEKEYQAELDGIEKELSDAKKEKQTKLDQLNKKVDLFGGEGKVEKNVLFDVSEDQGKQNIDRIIQPFDKKVKDLTAKRNDFIANKEQYFKKYEGQTEITQTPEAQSERVVSETTEKPTQKERPGTAVPETKGIEKAKEEVTVQDLQELYYNREITKQEYDKRVEKLRKEKKSDNEGGKGASIPVSLSGTGKPIRASQIIDKVKNALGIPIRTGHIRVANFAGIFQTRPETIRLREANDLATMAHEIAHFIDKKTGFRKLPLGKAIRDEVRSLDYYPKQRRVHEGFAEFVRHYITTGEAQAKAPKFYDYFTKDFLPKYPEFEKIVNEARDQVTLWREQGSLARVISQMDIEGKPTKAPLKDRLIRAKLKVQSISVNRLAPIRYVVNQVLKYNNAGKMRPSEDPYQLAMSGAKTASAKAYYYVKGKPFDYRTNETGKGLEEILSPINNNTKDADGFTDMQKALAYAYSKHALTLHKRGINPGISKADAMYVMDNYSDPRYEQFSKDITEWSNLLVDYLVDAGGLTPESAARMREVNPFYIPLKRVFDEHAMGLPRGSGVVDLPSPIKKIKGSGREIVNPIESLIGMTEQIIAVADKARVARSIADMYDKYEGMGKWVRKVPPPIESKTFELDQIAKQIEDMGGDLTDADLGSIITLFSQGRGYYGKDNIVSIFRDGKREYFELDPILYDGLKGLDNVTLPKVLDLTFGAATRLVRLGATGLRAGFSLITNPVRDVQTSILQSEYGGARPDRVARALANELVGGDKYAVAFRRAGGEMAQPLGLDRKMLRKVMNEILADNTKKKALNIVSHPIEAMRKVFSFTEAGVRLAEFKQVMKKYEPLIDDANSRGDLVEAKKLQEDAIVEASNAANEVTVNFKRAGTYGAFLNQVIPFFNPTIQGLSRMGRTVWEHPLRSAFRGMALLTAPSLALWYLHKDEEWYKNLPAWEKYAFWHFKLGETIWRLPMPFEWGYLFAGLPVGTAESIYKDDPKYIEKAFKESVGAVIPDYIPALVKPAVEVYFNWDMFRDRPIVSKSQEGLLPAQQYSEYTSWVAKKVGETLSVSPQKVDHLLSGYTGGLANDILNALPKEYKEKADWPVIGRLFTRNSSLGFGGETVQEFYDYSKRVESVTRTMKFSLKKGIIPKNLTEQDKMLYKLRSVVSSGANRLSQLRDYKLAISQMDIDPDIKKQINVAIDQVVVDIAEYANTLIEANGIRKKNDTDKLKKDVDVLKKYYDNKDVNEVFMEINKRYRDAVEGMAKEDTDKKPD
jgi:hypothetical protein